MAERALTTPTRWAACALTASLVLLLGGLPAAGAHQSGVGADDDPVFALSLTPTRVVVPASQLGQPQYVRVRNDGQESVRVDVGKRDFTQQPDGSLTFHEHAPYSASNWVQVDPPQFDLAPGKTAQIDVRVSVPDLPDAGDHQVVLVFLGAAPPGPENIRVNRGVGLPVFVTVPGPVDDSVVIENLQAPGFAMSGPLRLSATVRSVGTVHRDFRGPGVLGVDVAGRTVGFPDFTVTRGALREISTEWSDPPLACVCRAKVAVTGADGATQVLSVRIVVIPLHLIGALLAGVVLLFVIARLGRRHYRAQVRAAARGMHGTRDA